MKSKLQIAIRILIMTGILFLFIQTSVNATGSTNFGSQYYTCEKGEEFPVGVYIKADSKMSSYSMVVTYDTEVLKYVSGASKVEGGQLFIEGTTDAQEIKQMLRFKSLKEGETSITIAKASALGEQVEGNDAAPIEVAANVVAPILVEEASSNLLKEITISGDVIEGFDSKKFEYTISVDSDTEKLNIKAVTNNKKAIVKVPEKKLSDGENILLLVVSCKGFEDTKYTIRVIKPEKKKIVKEKVPIVSENTIEEVVSQNIIQSEDGQTPNVTDIKEGIFKWKILFFVLSMMLLIILILIFILKIKKKKKNVAVIHYVDGADALKKGLYFIDLEENVIEVNHVTMKFRMAKDESSSMKEYIFRRLKGNYKYHENTALRDVSFKIQRGEVIGVIGTNGSGKSTLLKIIAGSLIPTRGNVVVNQDKVQLLTLGTGFDMELTARENVYLNGSIIGYSKQFIDEHFDDIVKFAELEGFMDERIKNFSSGMVSRLGFAIATLREAGEILILDEVLSVGDMFFRRKSEKRIKELIHSGATVIIVSHSIDVIKKNCSRAVWIEKGILKKVGLPEEVCNAYAKMER